MSFFDAYAPLKKEPSSLPDEGGGFFRRKNSKGEMPSLLGKGGFVADEDGRGIRLPVEGAGFLQSKKTEGEKPLNFLPPTSRHINRPKVAII